MDRERISNKFCLKQLPFYSDLLCEQSCNVDCFKHESIIESDLYEKRRLRLIIDELSRANEDLIRERTLVEIKTRTRFDSFFHQIGQMQKERENAQKSWTKSIYLKDCEIEDLKDAIAKSGRAYLNELNDLKESEAKRAFIERLEVSKAKKTAKRLEKENQELCVALDKARFMAHLYWSDGAPLRQRLFTYQQIVIDGLREEIEKLKYPQKE